MKRKLILPALVLGASVVLTAGCGDGPSKNAAPTGDAAKTKPSQDGLEPAVLPDPPKDKRNE